MLARIPMSLFRRDYKDECQPVEPDETGLRDRSRHGVEAVETIGIGNQEGALCLERLPDRSILELGVGIDLGVGDRLIEQEGVQLLGTCPVKARTASRR